MRGNGGIPVRGNGHNIAAAGAIDQEFVSMGHYVPRNSPGTPQFLIRVSEGVGLGGAGRGGFFDAPGRFWTPRVRESA